MMKDNRQCKLFLICKCFLLTLLLIFQYTYTHAQHLIQIKHFGKNKGHLKMYVHIPSNIDNSKSLPLVVVLHGCLQCASKVEAQTGWSKMGDENNFYVMYPQQRFVNNPERCFKWYKRRHINKNRGENYSIFEMIEYMKSTYSIDSKQVYITGLSAGAAMSIIMMANYPETFKAGSSMAGGAYKAGNGMVSGILSLFGWRIKTPEKWGNMVRQQNPNFRGEYPKLIIYQGNNDCVVNKRNGVELMKQWTNLQNISIQPSEVIDGFVKNKDIQRNAYINKENKEVLVFYKVNKLNHALLIDLGACPCQGGKRGLFSRDKNFNSSLWTAYDFGLLATPQIVGKTNVKRLEEKILFTVPYSKNSKYDWSFPEDCKVISDENNGTITINWGNVSGAVNVVETDSNSCKKQYKTIFVKVEGN